MAQYKVSVCISVYNTEKYLSRCLDSVVNQTLDEMEIVLVNNGSTDGSETIMRFYQNKYQNRRIVIISQNDRGLAQGRQSGINNAQGEYLAFLDADDYVALNAYEEMIRIAEQSGADIVECETIHGNKKISSPYIGIMDTHQVLKDYFWGKKKIYPMIWMRLYKRSLFSKSVLPEMYVNNEDVFAFPCLMYKADKIAFIKKPLHVYSIDNENAVMIALSQKKELAEKYYLNRKKALKSISHIEDFIGIEKINDEMSVEFEQYKQRVMVTFVYSDIYGVSFKQKIQDITNEFGFKNSIETIRFIHANTKNGTTVNRTIKIFGLKNSFYIRKLKNIMLKR